MSFWVRKLSDADQPNLSILLAALRLRPLVARPKLLPAPRLAAPSATADSVRLRAMGASFYLRRSQLAALPLPPLGPRPKLLPAPLLAAPSATAASVRPAPNLHRPGAAPALPPAGHPNPGPYRKTRALC